jgi:DNA gyrase subunit A
MRDESDRQGMRLVVEVKRDAKPQTVLAQLYKHTALQSAYSMNMLALVDGEPRVLNLKRMLSHFLDHRHEALTRRTRYELRKAQERAHVLEGLKIALDHLDAVIRAIRQSESAAKAMETLMTRWRLSEIQARAILDMQLRRLAALERQEILDELAELRKTIDYLEDLLANPHKILLLAREELQELKKKYGDARRSRISLEDNPEITLEDLIANDETLVTVSNRGYVKRLPPDTYRAQRRGGRGIRGMVLRDEDAPRHMVVAKAHDNILFFTDKGRVFQLKAYQIPEAERTAKGTPIINVMNIDTKETVTAVITTAEFSGNNFLAMATKRGEIKKVKIEEFASVRSNGLIAMDLEPGDELGWVHHLKSGAEVILVTHKGMSARFKEANVPSRSRGAGGVRSIKLSAGDYVCCMDVVIPNGQLLIITERGMAKRTAMPQFPIHNRGVGGVIAVKITDKTGPVFTARSVTGDEEVMVMSSAGTVLRTPVSSVSVQGRPATGVAFMSLRPTERISAVALLSPSGEELLEEEGDGTNDNGRRRRKSASADAPKTSRPSARKVAPPSTNGAARNGRAKPTENGTNGKV